MDLEVKTRKDFCEYVSFCKKEGEVPRQWGEDFYTHWRWMQSNTKKRRA